MEETNSEWGTAIHSHATAGLLVPPLLKAVVCHEKGVIQQTLLPPTLLLFLLQSVGGHQGSHPQHQDHC